MANKQQLLEKVIGIFSDKYTKDEWDVIYEECGIFVDKLIHELGSLCEGMKIHPDIPDSYSVNYPLLKERASCFNTV